MSILTRVKLEDQGAVSKDDGESAWRSTLVAFGWGEAVVVADVHVDGYSGETVPHVLRDDLGLPPELAGRLVIALYRICGADMCAADSDLGEALCDIEALVRSLFYQSYAEGLLQKFCTAVAAAREAASTEPTTVQERNRVCPYEPIRISPS